MLLRERFIFWCISCKLYKSRVGSVQAGPGVDVAAMFRAVARDEQKAYPVCPRCGTRPPAWHFEHRDADAPVEPSGSAEIDAIRAGKPLPGALTVVQGKG